MILAKNSLGKGKWKVFNGFYGGGGEEIEMKIFWLQKGLRQTQYSARRDLETVDLFIQKEEDEQHNNKFVCALLSTTTMKLTTTLLRYGRAMWY